MGKDHTIIIVIPTMLPDADTYTVSISDGNIKFKADYDEIADLSYQGDEVFERIANNTQIGLVEYPSGCDLPKEITNVAYVEVRRAS